MVQRPDELNPFEFAVLAGLRAAQLARGSVPRVSGSHKLVVIALQEIAERRVVREVKVAAEAVDIVEG
jgi:DNA-directed RNA polymerase subunit K/omega